MQIFLKFKALLVSVRVETNLNLGIPAKLDLLASFELNLIAVMDAVLLYFELTPEFKSCQSRATATQIIRTVIL
jgi:hypothetical protein